MKRNREMNDFVLTSIFGAIILVLSLVPNIGFLTLGIIEVTIIHIVALIGISLVSRKYAVAIGFIFGFGSWLVAMTRPTGPIAYAFQYPWVSILTRMIFAYIAHLLFGYFKKLSNNKNGNKLIFSSVFVLLQGTLLLVAKFLINALSITKFGYMFYIGAFVLTMFLMFLYYLYTKNKKDNGYIIASLATSTIIHTIIVLGSLAYLVPRKIYEDVLTGGSDTLLNLFFGIAMSNGVFEVLLAILIGTPVIIALHNVIGRGDTNVTNI